MWNFKLFSSNIALTQDNNESITYGELEIQGANFNENLPSRSLVFCLCTNTIGSIIGYTSLLDNKNVPLLLNNSIDKGSFNYLFDIYLPNFVWLPKDSVFLLGANYEVVYEAYDYILCKTENNRSVNIHSDLALLLTTSGSTGSPKLVKQSFKNILSNTESIISYLKINSSEVAITTLPMSYTYGLSIINTHLFSGAKILLTDKALVDKEFWNFFKNEKATSFGGVPYTYEILNKLRFHRMKLPSLRYFTQAGGKLSPSLHKQLAEYAQENLIKFIVMYGQTEATARMAYLPCERSIEKYGFIGIAIPGGEFRLIDDNDETILDSGVVGELVYKGDNVTLGYAEGREDLSVGDERQGILFTGDMAERDEDGYYKIVGRKKRFLKIYGNRVNLDEVERIIKSKFEIIDCACSGIDDNLKIFIVDNIDSRKIIDFISSKTNLNRNAFQVVQIERIPMSESGKTLYSMLV